MSEQKPWVAITIALIAMAASIVSAIGAAIITSGVSFQSNLEISEEKVEKLREDQRKAVTEANNIELTLKDLSSRQNALEERIASAEPEMRTKKFNGSHSRGNWPIRAFVGTNSDSGYVLATLKDGNVSNGNLTVWAAHRNYGGRDGILVTVYSPTQLNKNYEVSINLFQKNATEYLEPIVYTDR